MNVAEQPAGVMIICVVAARAGENGEKVALLLGGDAALMGKLVRAGRGEQHCGRIHVDVRLARKREIEAREVHRAHDLRAEDALGRMIGQVEKGKFFIQAVVDRIGIGKDLLPVGGEEAVFVARDLP